MSDPKVYIVHLRQPDLGNPDESRSDPYFEFGSFGCTGCHSRNLLHPKRAAALDGARLAFAQGGPLGFRLVLLTPPIAIKEWAGRLEAGWKPAPMPFRYEAAPILVANGSESDFPKIEKIVRGTSRTTVQGGFSSCFRSRSTPLDDSTACELIGIFDHRYKAAATVDIAIRYEDAMPCHPPNVDRHRWRTYRQRISDLKLATGVSVCALPKNRTLPKPSGCLTR